MRKFLTIAALCLALIMLLSLTACGSEATTYTVTFNANGGELDGNATVEVKENEKITGAPTASKDGFTFDGWFDAATGGKEIDLSTYTVTKDVTLYAGYTEIGDPEPETYTVTFDANGGALSGDATIAVEEGQKITNAPTASKDGFTFDGWFDAATDGAKIDLATYVVTESVTLYAQYTEIEKPKLNIRLEAEDAEISGTPSYGDTFVETVDIASGGKSVGNFGTAAIPSHLRSA